MTRRGRDVWNTLWEAAAELGELAVLSIARRWLGIPALEQRVADLERAVATAPAPPPARRRRPYIAAAMCPRCISDVPMARRPELRVWSCSRHGASEVHYTDDFLEENYPRHIIWSDGS